MVVTWMFMEADRFRYYQDYNSVASTAYQSTNS